MQPRPNHRALLARRQALAALAATPVVSLAAVAHAQTSDALLSGELRPTAAQSLGPFYPREAAQRPRQIDNDLLTLEGDRLLTRGTPLYLTGRVLNRQGRPVANARVEIWQCDANAVYHHPAGGAQAERDPHFQGYGATQTDAAGGFDFRTIRPVAYPGRTPHIHVRVAASGFAALGTQLYLASDPGNARDFLYRQLSEADRAGLALALRPTEAQHPLARGTRESAAVDLVLA